MKPSVEAYLARIWYTGPREPTLAVLHEVPLHRTCHIPYESLDVYLQCPVTQDIDTIFEKIVLGRRGGWCYEMNGLLAWALAELGFAVTRQVGAVQARDDIVETTRQETARTRAAAFPPLPAHTC